jgi:hypothetical protein
MLRSMRDLEGYSIGAVDGPIGKVTDFYFDDASWVVRFLVVETGSWLSSRKVLISPIALGTPDWAYRNLPVTITREQVRASPDIDTERPVSRHYEAQYFAYYDYPYYWEGTGLWGGGGVPGMMLPGHAGGIAVPGSPRPQPETVREDDPHLRSCKAITGYEVRGSDGDIGHVQGFLLDEESWAIRYMVVDTSNWWLGHLVLVPPQWISDLDWPRSRASVHLTRDAVLNAPVYDPATALDRRHEIAIYKHYGRPVYWQSEPTAAAA